jgi:hypothetical protein
MTRWARGEQKANVFPRYSQPPANIHTEVYSKLATPLICRYKGRKGEVVTMVYLVRARDGASSLCLRRDTRESAEMTAVVLREKGYADVEIVTRQVPQKAA